MTDYRVAAVIPTLNGGAGFARVLDALRRQEGVGELELVVIDSASDDGTVDTAKEYGAKVIEIDRDAFGHGKTRDAAVSETRSDVVLMTVQDAVLVGRHAVRNLALELARDATAAAVSARHLPRSDSDLYGAWVVWSHERAIAGERARAQVDREPSTPEARRARASVEDTCALVRREAWEQIRFRDVPFAEDLDFGLRAAADGWRILLSDAAAVVHSHCRGADYHMRRNAVDRVWVAPLTGDDSWVPTAAYGLGALATAVSVVSAELEEAADPSIGDSSSVVFSGYLFAVAARLEEKPQGRPPTAELAAINSLLRYDHGTQVGSRAEREVSAWLRDALVGMLRWPPLHEWAGSCRRVEARDGRDYVAKLTGSLIGRCAGDAIRIHDDASEVARRLTSGV